MATFRSQKTKTKQDSNRYYFRKSKHFADQEISNILYEMFRSLINIKHTCRNERGRIKFIKNSKNSYSKFVENRVTQKGERVGRVWVETTSSK